MVLDIQTVHHILKNTVVQNENGPFVYITDLTSTLSKFCIKLRKIQSQKTIDISVLLVFFPGIGFRFFSNTATA
jgi:hypothetical protein